MTPVQKRFLLKEWETTTVEQSNLQKDAVELAVANAFRAKGRMPKKMWRKLVQEIPMGQDEKEKLAQAMADRPWVPWKLTQGG